jgi:DNA-binding CsgD family transcriptional regulator
MNYEMRTGFDKMMDWSSQAGLEGLKAMSFLFDQCADAVFVKDSNDRVVIANDTFISAFANVDPIGLCGSDFLPPELRDISIETDKLVRQTGRMACFSYTIEQDSGHTKRFCVIKVPLISKDGEQFAMVCTSFPERDDRLLNDVPTAATLLNAHQVVSSYSRKQRAVVEAVCDGLINREIARTLGMSLRSVESYRSKSVRELGLDSVAELIRLITTLESNGISIRDSKSHRTQSESN